MADRRRRDRRRSGGAARRPLRRHADDRRLPAPGSRRVDRREGPQRLRLQGARVLGQRGLPASLLLARHAPRRAAPAALPNPPPRRGGSPRRRGGLRRRVVSVGVRRHRDRDDAAHPARARWPAAAGVVRHARDPSRRGRRLGVRLPSPRRGRRAAARRSGADDPLDRALLHQPRHEERPGLGDPPRDQPRRAARGRLEQRLPEHDGRGDDPAGAAPRRPRPGRAVRRRARSPAARSQTGWSSLARPTG